MCKLSREFIGLTLFFGGGPAFGGQAFSFFNSKTMFFKLLLFWIEWKRHNSWITCNSFVNYSGKANAIHCHKPSPQASEAPNENQLASSARRPQADRPNISSATEQEMHNLMTNWHPICPRIVILELFALLHLLVGKLGDHNFTGEFRWFTPCWCSSPTRTPVFYLVKPPFVFANSSETNH